MVYGERWMPYDGHLIELGDGRRVPLETLLVEARRLRAAELRSLWYGAPACGAHFARSLRRCTDVPRSRTWREERRRSTGPVSAPPSPFVGGRPKGVRVASA